HALKTPLPALTIWLIDELWLRLCPGSSTITLPASEPVPAGGAVLGWGGGGFGGGGGVGGAAVFV
ncbi:MAG: hypothetical protein QOG69_1890, partial [Actinomycetota bacterium]|nr:hypothetical protein [Actinomycetota bacterium]